MPGSERGTRTICLLEAGVDSGCDGTFVERIAVLSENIANCKENIRLSPLPSPVRPTWNLSQILEGLVMLREGL